MAKLVRITRFANEGFVVRKTISPFRVYQREIQDFSNDLFVPREDPYLTPELHTLEGCYCFFSEFSNESVKRILASRYNNAINIGFLPEDYPVLVRNAKPDGSRILHVYKDLQDPVTKKVHRFEDDASTDSFVWIRMKLSNAIQRNNEYKRLKNMRYIEEKYSEMFLTAEDFNHLKYKQKYPSWTKILFSNN